MRLQTNVFLLMPCRIHCGPIVFARGSWLPCWVKLHKLTLENNPNAYSVLSSLLNVHIVSFLNVSNVFSAFVGYILLIHMR